MINRKLKFTLGAGLLLLPAGALAVSTVNSIDFQTADNSSQLTIQADGPVTYETQENAEGHLIVIELKGAKLGPKAQRKLDTSSFNSRVDLVSPYQPKDQPDTARIVLHLRDMASAEVTQDKNTIKVTIPNTGDAGDTAAKNKDAPPENGALPPAAKADAPPAEGADAKTEKTNLDEFVDNSETKRFTGKPITLQVRDAELSDVLRLIGEASGFNIVVGDGVGGKITLSLIDVPWDQALDVILHTKRLGAERRANILRIVTLQNLTTEKEEQFKAKEAAQKSAPRVTRIFPVSYADAKELVPILNNFGKSGPTAPVAVGVGGAAAPAAGQNGPVQVDTRTNSLIVQDIPENIDRMKKLIDLLDTQTPQVMVEAKVVEATDNFGKNIQGSLGFGSSASNNPQSVVSFNGANPVDPLLGTPGVFATGTAIPASATSPGTGIFGLSPSISFIPGISRLNAILNLQESEDKVKIISSPKIVVLNKKEAQIISGQPVLVPQTQNIPGLPSSTITTVQNANLSLDVTPTVTNSGSVQMVLKIQRDLVQTSGTASLVAPRNMNTEVLVDSGTTLVIGGIYSTQSEHSETGFPILKDLPILGWLFGNKSDTAERTELFIFITPRVINEEESGLSG